MRCLIWRGVQGAENMALFLTVYTINWTDNRVWVTIYDLAKTTHLDYGWVAARSYRTWTSGNYAAGSFYHVRGEVKSDAAGNDPNIYDTSIQINPQLVVNDFPITVPTGDGRITRTNIGATESAVAIMKGQGNYYWEITMV